MNSDIEAIGPAAGDVAETAFAELSRRPATLARLRPASPAEGVAVGTVVGLVDQMTPLVTYDGMSGAAAVQASTLVDIHGGHVGRQVVLSFVAGSGVPVILGLMRTAATPGDVQPMPGRVDITADGQRMTVTARDQLVLRCGRASITLTSSGKVLIEGAYVSSRSSGLARIRGASVEIN